MLLGLNVIDSIGAIEVLQDESCVLERNVRPTKFSLILCHSTKKYFVLITGAGSLEKHYFS